MRLGSIVVLRIRSRRKEPHKAKKTRCFALGFVIFTASGLIRAEDPALDPNLIDQADIESGTLGLDEIREAGLLVYTTPFNREDGYGDGPLDSLNPDKTLPGNRPSLQNSSSPLLRVNGLDAQTCLECHSVLSRASTPMELNIGGAGGANNNAIALPTEIDVDDSEENGFARLDGRFINPPFNFGGGAIELLAKEMTAELQGIKAQAEAAPAGTVFELVSKGVSFGTATSLGGGNVAFDIDGDGLAIDEDLVVRPFGRKGEFASIREFDQGAMPFHLGMEPVEVVGEGVDADDDGVVDEVTVGEMSALSIFMASLPNTRRDEKSGDAELGEQLFHEIGCSNCHIPQLETDSPVLTFSFPEVPTDPDANVFLSMDLSQKPMDFDASPAGGIAVDLFADLKRHDMGPELAETTGGDLDRFFTTARLWGVADTAPYLHDGRALTLTDAIIAHGGEAESQSQNFRALTEEEQNQLLEFLQTLRTPTAQVVNQLKEASKN